jgi:hypothetical protein
LDVRSARSPADDEAEDAAASDALMQRRKLILKKEN